MHREPDTGGLRSKAYDRINRYLEESEVWRDDALDGLLDDLSTVKEDPEVIRETLREGADAGVLAVEYMAKDMISFVKELYMPGYESDFHFDNIAQYRESKR